MGTEIEPGGKGTRTELVKELRSLAGEERLAGRRVQLQALADALESGDRLDEWAEVDLAASFPATESIAPEGQRGALRGAVESLPTVLVFFPILTTWSGLALAAGAHGRSGDDPSLQGLSFLERWQNGFNGELPAWLAFDQVAFYTLTAIVLLIGAVLAQTLHRRRFHTRDEHERADLALRLVSVMTAVRFELAGVRIGSTATIAQTLGSSVQRLREFSDSVKDSHEGFEEAARTAYEGFERAARTAHEGFEEAARTAYEGLEGAARTAHEGFEQTARTAYEDFSRVVRQAEEGVVDTLEQTRSSMGEAQKAVTALKDSSQTLAEAVDEGRTATGTLHDRFGEVAGLLERIATVSEELSRVAGEERLQLRGELQQLVTELADRVDRAVNQGLENMADSLSASSEGISRALGEWADAGSGFAHRAELAADLSGRVADGLRELPEAVERLGSSIGTLRQDLDTAAEHDNGLTEAVTKLYDGIDSLRRGRARRTAPHHEVSDRPTPLPTETSGTGDGVVPR